MQNNEPWRVSSILPHQPILATARFWKFTWDSPGFGVFSWHLVMRVLLPFPLMGLPRPWQCSTGHPVRGDSSNINFKALLGRMRLKGSQGRNLLGSSATAPTAVKWCRVITVNIHIHSSPWPWLPMNLNPLPYTRITNICNAANPSPPTPRHPIM